MSLIGFLLSTFLIYSGFYLVRIGYKEFQKNDYDKEYIFTATILGILLIGVGALSCMISAGIFISNLM